jgi:drug/metabolite transporter (DMT)-like permease
MLVAASVGWGSATTLSAFALRQLSPVDLLVVELLSGGVVIWTAALAHGWTKPHHWRAFAVLGLCEPGLTYLLANEGLRRDSAATASLLFAMEAMLVVPLAVLFLGERVSAGVLGALGLGLVGVVVVGAGAHGGQDTLIGHLLILASALAAATYAVLARRTAYRSPALLGTAYQLLAATAIIIPVAIASHAVSRSGLPAGDLAHWAAAIAAGLAGVALPFLLYNRAVVRVRATIAAGVLNLIPLVGFVTAVLALNNRPTLVEMLGGGVILASIAWISRSEIQASPGKVLGDGGVFRRERSETQ